jgi:hypothetical protein
MGRAQGRGVLAHEAEHGTQVLEVEQEGSFLVGQLESDV